ncbi:hypothetical protein [Pseudofrankia inefficax]|uniref:PIN domain-containing protein n=1 Tax=Pseudofrankia inefficax (strain DSM 45817 / CECT 9037 / DDB 130130 / EuI1c) TaxID=298654 RepID=E3JAS3_PSEI1|nr:hypothetical protein [Pseudofrankia inefficax]ADP83411.1 hypothetical protein FraEuI1c_5424 [Pseudofrankia inefficax]
MAVLLFPDNTVLINFAVIDRMDLLGRLANDNGRWCPTVAAECAASGRLPDLGALAHAREIFGAPLAPTPAELRDAQLLRAQLAKPGDHPHKHLGEAETVAIMTRRDVDGFFVTDDNEAARLATRHGIPVIRTWQLLRLTVRAGWAEADTVWSYVQLLRARQRGGPPGVTDRPSFDKWLQS